jgi:hypothetical protein
MNSVLNARLLKVGQWGQGKRDVRPPHEVIQTPDL